MKNNYSRYFYLLLFLFLFTIYSCSGEDRSNERPLVPVVRTLNVEVYEDSCVMNGAVVESHNSTLRECGFVYGQENKSRIKEKVEELSSSFSIYVDSLKNGDYFYFAYARNGVGTSYGDTLHFRIDKK